MQVEAGKQSQRLAARLDALDRLTVTRQQRRAEQQRLLDQPRHLVGIAGEIQRHDARDGRHFLVAAHGVADGGVARRIGESFYYPNGLAIVDGGHSLVIAETYRQRLWKGDWDAASARWLHPRPWVDVGGPTGPDGMALGPDGLLYVAVYGSGQVKVVEAGGKLVGAIDVAGKNPTNVAFDPAGRLGLVVTEAERGLLISVGSPFSSTMMDGDLPPN